MLKLLQVIFTIYWCANLGGAIVLWISGFLPPSAVFVISLFLLSNFIITEFIKRLPAKSSLLLEQFRYWVLAPFISALLVVVIPEPLSPFWYGFLTLALGTGPMILRSRVRKIPHGLSYGFYLAGFYTLARLYAGGLATPADWTHHAVQTCSILLVTISYSLTVSRLGGILATIAEREQYLNEMQEIAKVGDYRFLVRENSLHLSRGCSRILGHGDKPIEAQLELLLNSVHPEDRSKFENSFMQTIRLGTDSELQFRIVDPAGKIRYVRCVRHAERSEETGQVLRIKGIMQDMTENHLMYEAQRETDALLKAVVNELPVGIAYRETAGGFKLRNSAYEKIEKQVLLSPSGAEADQKMTEARSGFASRITLNFTTDDGGEGTAEITYHPFKSELGEVRGVILSALDITAEKRAEELAERQRALVINASRMSSLGEMASGIAHEINNPLAVISGKTQQLVRRYESGDFDSAHAVKQLQTVDAMVKRIAAIIRGLRSFARDGQNDPFDLADLRVMIDDTVTLCQSRFQNHEVRLETPKFDNEILIECRAVQITQVLLNLLNNAYDAVKELPEKWVRLTVSETSDRIVFAVTDSGPGIPIHLREKILKPFFTTKAVGEGTGLGLSIATGIASDHFGKLEIDGSLPNTCFTLTLPKKQVAVN